jgi:hypothetical protein
VAVRHGRISNVSPEDAAAERRVGPMARQICHGSNKQLMIDAQAQVSCPLCLREFPVETTVRNRQQICPVVPSHMADQSGLMQVAVEKREQRKFGSAPRPW